MTATRRPSRLVLALSTAVVLGAGASPAVAASPTELRTDGIGPLTLGMKRADAVATGWLANRGTGCPLGGGALPITYALRGTKAPKALRGAVEFRGGRLRTLSFSRGVRTTEGVTVGTTTSRMVSRYRAAGFTVERRSSSTFGGTFVGVAKGSTPTLGAFASGSGRRITDLAIPAIPVCE